MKTMNGPMLALVLILALGIPLLAFASDFITLSDGTVIEVPEGYKVVIVPEDAPSVCVGVELFELIMPVPVNCLPEGELQVSPGLPTCP